jgi:hypothetical protein
MIDSYQEVAARLRRGVVTERMPDGRLVVREEWSERVFNCDTLRLIAGPRLEYAVGTDVLILAADDDEDTGYVLGALGRPNAEEISSSLPFKRSVGSK